MSYATSRFSNKNLPYSTLCDLEGLLDELENIFPNHEYLVHGYDILNDDQGEFNADEVYNFMEDLQEIVIINSANFKQGAE